MSHPQSASDATNGDRRDDIQRLTDDRCALKRPRVQALGGAEASIGTGLAIHVGVIGLIGVPAIKESAAAEVGIAGVDAEQGMRWRRLRLRVRCPADVPIQCTDQGAVARAIPAIVVVDRGVLRAIELLHGRTTEGHALGVDDREVHLAVATVDLERIADAGREEGARIVAPVPEDAVGTRQRGSGEGSIQWVGGIEVDATTDDDLVGQRMDGGELKEAAATERGSRTGDGAG